MQFLILNYTFEVPNVHHQRAAIQQSETIDQHLLFSLKSYIASSFGHQTKLEKI